MHLKRKNLKKSTHTQKKMIIICTSELYGVTKNIIHTITERFKWEVTKIGHHISANKTVIMRIGYIDRNNNSVPLISRHLQIEEVVEFFYLGSFVASDRGVECNVACWLSFKDSNPSEHAGRSS